eukprot:Awhi_evm1s12942
MHARFMVATNDNRNTVYSCLGGTKHTIPHSDSFNDCASKAEFTQANFFNYQLGTSTCELLSCPPGTEELLTKPENNWVAYR